MPSARWLGSSATDVFGLLVVGAVPRTRGVRLLGSLVGLVGAHQLVGVGGWLTCGARPGETLALSETVGQGT
jgi:hypothetical protein